MSTSNTLTTEPFSTIRLRDGRTLAYIGVGRTNGPAIFHFHGHGSSRLEALLLGEQATDFGVSVIALDRPGIGRSDSKPGDQLMVSFAKMLSGSEMANS
jgi:pimeloyl-ACP methyl ester carboxylesterase